MKRRHSGFTLIEMLAVIFFTVVVTASVATYYVQFMRSSTSLQERTRNTRRAVAILDRVARDLEGAFLMVKPEEMDPIEHPWLFLGESRDSDTGSESIKFISQSQALRASAARRSPLGQIAYVAAKSDDGDLALFRWSASGLPEELDRRLPREGDEGVLLMSEGLQRFGVRFMTEDGDWEDEWDSSTLERSGELPIAAEIEVALTNLADPEGEPIGPFKRRVLIPLRPISREELKGELSSNGGEDDGDGEEQCLTVGQCLLNPSPDMVRLFQDNPDACARDHLGEDERQFIASNCLSEVFGDDK